MGPEYREEPCRSALNRVKGMGFKWSLNPYMGCVHRCTFCYVRAFERRADRPSDDRYGTLDPRQDQRRRRPPPRARASLLGARVRGDRRRHRPVPARGRALSADARLHRGARRSAQPVRHHHARAHDRPRHRRPRRGRQARERLGHVLDPDPRREGLAQDRAVDRPPAPEAQGRVAARRRGNQDRRRDGSDPAGDLRPPRAAARGRQGSTRGGCDRRLDEPPLPQAWNPRALPAAPRRGLARARAEVSRAVPRAGPTSGPKL